MRIYHAGKRWLVAHLCSMVEKVVETEGVLTLHPADEIVRSAPLWNGKPILLRHAVTANGAACSVKVLGVVGRQGLGVLAGTYWNGGRLVHAARFNEERLAFITPDVLQALLDGKALAVSSSF